MKMMTLGEESWHRKFFIYFSFSSFSSFFSSFLFSFSSPFLSFQCFFLLLFFSFSPFFKIFKRPTIVNSLAVPLSWNGGLIGPRWTDLTVQQGSREENSSVGLPQEKPSVGLPQEKPSLGLPQDYPPGRSHHRRLHGLPPLLDPSSLAGGAQQHPWNETPPT